MYLCDQLRVERENRGQSRAVLQNRLKDVNVDVSISKIKDWENGNSQIPPKALVAISLLYEVSIDDLVDPTVEPTVDMDTEFYKLGKSIHNYCGSTDATSFLQKYQIFDKSSWIPSPKYDLIMRLYTTYLKKPRNDFSIAKITLESCTDWITPYSEEASSKERNNIYSNLYTDSAGLLKPDDKREPVIPDKLNKEIYELKSDLAYFIENYNINGVEVNLWHYLDE